MNGLNVPFDKVLEIVSEQLIIAKDEICIALEKLKNGDKESVHWSREQDSYNRAIDDAIQVVKNH